MTSIIVKFVNKHTYATEDAIRVICQDERFTRQELAKIIRQFDKDYKELSEEEKDKISKYGYIFEQLDNAGLEWDYVLDEALAIYG